MKINQRGFGLVETLLVIIIVGILGAAGWYVYTSNKKANKSLDNAGTSVDIDIEKKTEEKDPTADWVTYTNKPGKFTLKHPNSWIEAANPELCTETLFLVGADAKSVGTCASENGGQMGVSSSEGDSRAEQGLPATQFKNVSKTEVNVQGVKGERQEGTASGQSGELSVGEYANGTKVVIYLFFTNNRTYYATYVQDASYTDVLSDFDLMITKTLKFN